ncbi:MAG: class I SAM-dependent methyltransferase [Armatimonadota bacterium]
MTPAQLLPQLGRLDLFIHDGLHSYWNIRRELDMITPYLSRPTVVITDDIESNTAFSE